METFKDLITRQTCKSTIAGWVWYCDSCDTHGNANSSDEAHHMAEAHAKYYSWDEDQEHDEENDPEGEKITSYMDLPHEDREFSLANWSMECLGATYIIDVTENITYEYGDDYKDKTPNQPYEVDKAVRLKKYLGVE